MITSVMEQYQMNNEGLQVCCQSCATRMIETFSSHNVVLTVSNLRTENDKCTMEDGLLGGKCGNSAQFMVTIVEDKRPR